MSSHSTILDLHKGKPTDVQLLYLEEKKDRFKPDEVDFILKNAGIDTYVGNYFIWKQQRKNGLYIGFSIDQQPRSQKRVNFENAIDVIAKRSLSDIEKKEVAENYGCANRKHIVYLYDHIERLIYEDDIYGITTPKIFVDKCKELGYSDPSYQPNEPLAQKQTKLNFNES